MSGFGLILAICAGCAPSARGQKAVLSTKQAVTIAGDFSDNDHRLYAKGVQHIRNQHGYIGAYTIQQVIDQEQGRETSREAFRQKQEERQLDAESTANLTASMKLANMVGSQIYQGGSVSGTDCAIRIDGDLYENASEQDKDLMKSTVATMCSASYTALGVHARRLPDAGLSIHVYNLADDVVYSDTIEPGAEPRVAQDQKVRIAHADARGAYKVLQHWDIPCSGNGGFGEKVMALSHRQSDLEAVYRRWMAEHTFDRSQCVNLYAFASQLEYDAFENTANYSDAQLEAIPVGLQYMNNPNTGDENWSVGGGEEHVLRGS